MSEGTINSVTITIKSYSCDFKQEMPELDKFAEDVKTLAYVDLPYSSLEIEIEKSEHIMIGSR